MQYADALENTMSILDYSISFSTLSDRCNYVFNKLNPRLTIDIDDFDVKNKLKLPSKLMFTSNANTAWMAFDFSKFCSKPLFFNEDFSIGMFIIIDYLARRRASKEEG